MPRSIAAAASLLFIFVHGPGGQEIEINVKEISSLREPRVAEHFAPNTHCLVYMTSGTFISTSETCEEILAKVKQ